MYECGILWPSLPTWFWPLSSFLREIVFRCCTVVGIICFKSYRMKRFVFCLFDKFSTDFSSSWLVAYLLSFPVSVASESAHPRKINTCSSSNNNNDIQSPHIMQHAPTTPHPQEYCFVSCQYVLRCRHGRARCMTPR